MLVYLFNAFNAIEQRAAEAGTNISLFGNINNNPNSTKYLV
jgi:iron complex outermembrane receptor protein